MLDALKKEGSAFRLQDCGSLFRKISSNDAASDSMLNFMTERWDEILERLGKDRSIFQEILSSITSTINTRGDLEKLRNFRTRVKSAEQYGIEKLEEPIEVAISWRETNQKFVTQYVEELTKQLRN
uniref:ERAP1_C domain-containing protein n=1 Tax=Caenorhabditis japonica TaxID=281687 RepID=A0A8R1DG44_CAEJA